MLGSFFRNEAESQLSKNEENVDQRSYERQTNTSPSGEDFRSLLNIISGKSREITAKTANREITSQVFSKMKWIKLDLNLQIRETIELVISEHEVPAVRDPFGKLGPST